jgi:hypothetical protein
MPSATQKCIAQRTISNTSYITTHHHTMHWKILLQAMSNAQHNGQHTTLYANVMCASMLQC